MLKTELLRDGREPIETVLVDEASVINYNYTGE